jgi:hypothetical protein
MPLLKRYRFYCMTDGMWVETDYLMSEPVHCPNSDTHYVDLTDLTIVDSFEVRSVLFQAFPVYEEVGDYRFGRIEDNESFSLSWMAPYDLQYLCGLGLIVVSPRDLFNRSFAIFSDYGQVGEVYDKHSEAAIITQTIRGATIEAISMLPIYTQLSGMDVCGLRIVPQDIGSYLNVVGLRVCYRPE